ncbi:hypothetical protein D3Z63_18745 [Vibrio parahaemolyticus]|uniref:Uncharacterized protein n=1 Tax=Vibrio parahaemolyticus TaxID=670 RepID=A0A2R9VNM6_VIBPH|nr:hypothetical protein RK51_009015 [Vibrio parahaemolyticus]QGG33274.1 hypothetical protein GH799_09275 [Vibrio parahaemolyticus 10329]AUW38862.1 hypothetical protein AL464_24080 [Vibrio parahaemolyticus]AVW95543.1 hypothetical protein DA442_10695 [Vibrio parahaemolyticus]AWA89829.1 hypothetical protein BSG32_12640 [Vibrio parahaemolyticus]
MLNLRFEQFSQLAVSVHVSLIYHDRANLSILRARILITRLSISKRN